jgi:predicted nucleotidyltransferase
MVDETLERLLLKARQDGDVLAVLLFGSRARGEAAPDSDVDVCLVLQARRYDPLALSLKKLEYLKMGGLDVHVYQQLPLYIRRRVLKEGEVLYVRDEEALYETAFRTARAFEDFKHHYHAYLDEVARAGS